MIEFLASLASSVAVAFIWYGVGKQSQQKEINRLRAYEAFAKPIVASAVRLRRNLRFVEPGTKGIATHEIGSSGGDYTITVEMCAPIMTDPARRDRP